MSYVKHILQPSEQILYDGHVHPTVLLPGTLLLGFATFILTMTGDTGTAYSFTLHSVAWMRENWGILDGLYRDLLKWHRLSPGIDLDLKIVAGGIALYGFYRLMQGVIKIQSTELLVTDQRVIAKTGMFTVVTVEMDRHRIAGVTVYQTFPGRIMGYGTILIQGFTSHIGGLPPMVNPHLVERFVG